MSFLCIGISSEGIIDGSSTFYKTYGPFLVSKEAVNWTDAKTECQNAGLELVSILSEEEQTALKIFIRENKLIPKDKWSGYWLAGMRQDDGKYYWDTTGTEVDSSFQGWSWGEPSHAYGREDCVELKWTDFEIGWNDYFCDETRRFICQVPRKNNKPKIAKKTVQKVWFSKEWQRANNVVDFGDYEEDSQIKEGYTDAPVTIYYPERLYGTLAPVGINTEQEKLP